MEAASSLIPTNHTGPMINYKLSGHAPFFKFTISSFNENVNVFKKLYSSYFLNFELKARLLIIIMRPTASLTRC
ncbi:hypothetical protein A9E74_02544 [Methylophaga muralis]|uniref:Uncharacterized protein n=1 Tax=Methylophaga muralis TaxID=291169 RepID=A0A1E3GNT3_9GAMM|nr:hypothetical protein A9E74_02544 [Methylophaga muralis]